MRIVKVKRQKGHMFIQWEVDREDGEMDIHTLRSSEEPRPEFDVAWKLLAGAIADEAELPAEMTAFITPRGLSISYYDDGRWGAAISGVRALDHSYAPLVLNTPHKPEEAKVEGDDKILTGETIEVIGQVLIETEKYLQGERAQMPLLSVGRNNAESTT